MTQITPQAFEICRAKPEDLTCILAWLQVESENDPGGYWFCRSSIRMAHEVEDELWVYRQRGEAVGFQVGDYAAAYLAVRNDLRRGKIGTALVDASIARAIRDDLNVLEVQCEPRASLRFWQSLGFEQFSYPARPNEIHVRRLLPRAWLLPPGEPIIQVRFRFYNEDALWGDKTSASPFEDEIAFGARLGNGLVQLDRRVVCLDLDQPDEDIVISIEVDGQEQYFGKAKYEGALRLGVKRDGYGGLFYIDQIQGHDR